MHPEFGLFKQSSHCDLQVIAINAGSEILRDIFQTQIEEEMRQLVSSSPAVAFVSAMYQQLNKKRIKLDDHSPPLSLTVTNTFENACVKGVEAALETVWQKFPSLSLRDMLEILPSVLVSCVSKVLVAFVSKNQDVSFECCELKSFIEWISKKKDILSNCCICNGKFSNEKKPMRGKQNSAIEILQDVFLFHEAASKTVEGVHDDASVLANILKKHSHQNMNDVNLVRSKKGKDIFFGLSNQLSRFLSNDLELPEEMTTSYDAFRMIIKHHCEVVWSAVISKLSIHYRGCVQQERTNIQNRNKIQALHTAAASKRAAAAAAKASPGTPPAPPPPPAPHPPVPPPPPPPPPPPRPSPPPSPPNMLDRSKEQELTKLRDQVEQLQQLLLCAYIYIYMLQRSWLRKQSIAMLCRASVQPLWSHCQCARTRG
jgi:hypothetical protein